MLKQFFALFITEKTPSPGADDQPGETPQQADVSPWKLPGWQAAFLLLFALTVGLILALRLFQLDTLQNEIYGDIDIVFKYLADIFAGGWPVAFILSAGPLYHYLIAPVIFITGLDYAGLKLASVIVSLAGLAATYAFSRRLVNDYFALLVLFVAGVSSWLLIFSRLGNSQIALPLLTMLTLWLVMRIVQFGRQRDVVVCALVSGLGLLLYPQSFIQPGVIFLTLLCLGWVGHALPKNWARNFIVASIPFVVILGMLVASDPANFNSYIGDKIQPPTEGENIVGILASNVVKTMLALHVRGDEGIRSNPENFPQLDWLSGILFLVGIVFWMTKKERRRWVPVWLVPLVLLQVPAILVINHPAEVPSASRTLGVAPIIYFLVASGLWWLIQFVHARGKRWLTGTIAGLLAGSILMLNIGLYFQTYIPMLPYSNTPIGQTVAAYADTLPDHTQVYMVGCCWEFGMPENFVAYQMTHPENLHYIEPVDVTCAQLQSIPLPAVFIWSFHSELAAPQLEGCKPWLAAQLYTYQSRPVFHAATLNPDMNLLPNGVLPPDGEILSHDEVQINGETAQVDYSPIDTGSIGELFDGDTETLIRGKRDNPMVVVLNFWQARKIEALGLNTGSMQHFQVTVILTYADNSSQSINNDYENLPDDPHVEIALPESSQLITSVRLMVEDMNPLGSDTEYHIHLRELQVK